VGKRLALKPCRVRSEKMKAFFTWNVDRREATRQGVLGEGKWIRRQLAPLGKNAEKKKRKKTSPHGNEHPKRRHLNIDEEAVPRRGGEPKAFTYTPTARKRGGLLLEEKRGETHL